jgi:aryl-alcohol dehydrogenase-like predicted oxidoreductase
VLVSIPGTVNLTHLEENVNSLTLKLTVNDLQEIEKELSIITVHGARYSASLQKNVGK